jgi:hypothetical protein
MENELNNKNEQEKNQGFSMPEGYFLSSSTQLFDKLMWLEEHKAYPTLQSLKDKKGFVVPENYFEKLEQKIELLPYDQLTTQHQKPHPFKTPTLYFEETTPIYAQLERIEKINPFDVPSNYFEKTKQKLYPKTRIINLFTKRIRYSIAALLTICLGIWLIQALSEDKIEKDCGTLACIDKNDLLKSTTIQNLDDDNLYDVVNAKALEEKLLGKKTEKILIDSALLEAAEENIDEL